MIGKLNHVWRANVILLSNAGARAIAQDFRAGAGAATAGMGDPLALAGFAADRQVFHGANLRAGIPADRPVTGFRFDSAAGGQ